MEPLLLIGGGGHCKACIDVIKRQEKYQIAGIIDLPGQQGETLLDYPVVGTDDDLPQLLGSNPAVLITLGFSRGSKRRQELYRQLDSGGGKLATIISPLAHIAAHARLAEGTIVMHQALVNADARIGVNTVINSQALVEHDCTIGNHCHIATGARINGGCRIGDNCQIGSGGIILPGCSVAANTLIGAGAVVTQSITTPGVYVGCPARPLTGQETRQ